MEPKAQMSETLTPAPLWKVTGLPCGWRQILDRARKVPELPPPISGSQSLDNIP